jgi:hypothetical protein
MPNSVAFVLQQMIADIEIILAQVQHQLGKQVLKNDSVVIVTRYLIFHDDKISTHSTAD